MTPQVVLITGASSGIGYASALAFARHGCHVTGTARRSDRLAQLGNAVAALPAPHGEFLAAAADVRDPQAMFDAVSRTVERFGRLDVLVANAGLGQRGSLVDSSWNDIETVMRTNMDGVLHSIRAAVPAMRAAGGGHIILVSSVVYNMTSPYAAIYAASKAFVSSVGRSLRLELEQDRIRVTEMRIGRTESEFNDRRLGQAGYGQRASRLPRMTAQHVADAIVRASQGRRKAVTLRWFDRFVLLANLLVPDLVGRQAMKQYR